VANRRSPIAIVAGFSSRCEDAVYPTEVRVDPPEGGLSVASVERCAPGESTGAGGFRVAETCLCRATSSAPRRAMAARSC
jgi:hypothetical protein